MSETYLAAHEACSLPCDDTTERTLMHVLWRGDILQRLRLVSGLILFAFATTHFLNHALGLISVDAMQEAQKWRWAVTRSMSGTIVLAAALVMHIALALYKLARRSTLRMPPWELVQLVGGLTIPFLLFPHIVNTRSAKLLFGVNDTYIYELLKLWPSSAITQSLLLLFVWVHGCIGIHFWLRLYGPYRRLQPMLLAFAILVPLAALGGFMVGGRGITAVAEDPNVLATFKQMTHWPSDADADKLAWIRTLIRWQYAAVLAIVLSTSSGAVSSAASCRNRRSPTSADRRSTCRLARRCWKSAA